MNDEWHTPPEIVRALGQFDLDPACGPLCESKTARRRFGPREDGLRQKWHGRVWLNPPFHNLRPFVLRMAEHGNGIALLPTYCKGLWMDDVFRKAGWLFRFKRAIQFRRPGAESAPCPFSVMLLPFGEANAKAIQRSGLEGLLYKLKS